MAVMTGNQVQGSSSTVGTVAEEAKDAAGHVAQIAREQIGTRAEAGKDRAAEGLQDVASTIRGTKDHLPEPLENYVDQAAGWVEGLASYFRDRDVPTMLHDAETWARREPTVFLGGAFLLGMLGARFFKASASRRYDELESDDLRLDLESERRASPLHQPSYQTSGSAPYASTSGSINRPVAPTYPIPRTGAPASPPARAPYPGSLSEARAAGMSPPQAPPQAQPTGPVRTQVNVKTEGMTSASNNPNETSPGAAARPNMSNPMGRADLPQQPYDAKLGEQNRLESNRLGENDRPRSDAPRAPIPGVGSMGQHAAGTPGHAQPSTSQAVHDERAAGGARPAEFRPDPLKPQNPTDNNHGGNRT